MYFAYDQIVKSEMIPFLHMLNITLKYEDI